MKPTARRKKSADGWRTIESLLTVGWKAEAKRCRALTRRRRIRKPGQLLRVFLIYLTGSSLRNAVTDAEVEGIAVLSDTALFNRLCKASRWLQWLALDLLQHFRIELLKPDWLRGFRVKCIDATGVRKPGGTGTDWRLHFCLGLFDLVFDQFQITGSEIGESFRNFVVRPGDLLLGDGGYAHLSGLGYVVKQGGDFLIRMYHRAFALYHVEDGHKISLLSELKKLGVGVVGEWRVKGRDRKGNEVLMRVCAQKLNRPEARRAQRAALHKAKRKGEHLSQDALDFHRYVVVATSVSEDRLTADQVLRLYRMRWQIEIAFKRLKTIIGLSKLTCRGEESGRAWLQGKLVLALLVQVLMNRGQELRLLDNGVESDEAESAKSVSSLWREMGMVVGMVGVTVRTGISLQKYLEMSESARRKLSERPRKRRYQHELLAS